MKEVIKYLIGILVLMLGYFLGTYLRKITKDEQVVGRKYFKAISILSILTAIFGLITGKDWILFTFAFFATITSRSLK